MVQHDIYLLLEDGICKGCQWANTRHLIISLYVDDLIYIGNDQTMMNEFKECGMEEFEMSDLEIIKYFMLIEVLQLDNEICMCPRNNVKELLTKFKMEESNSVLNPIVLGYKIHKDKEGVKVNITLYKQFVGSMIYVTAIRPNVMYVVSLISRYMSMLIELHFAANKIILTYLQGTIE